MINSVKLKKVYGKNISNESQKKENQSYKGEKTYILAFLTNKVENRHYIHKRHPLD